MRLKALQAVGEEKKNLIISNIAKIQEKGFPNCFGSQRFGKRNKNFWEAKSVINPSVTS